MFSIFLLMTVCTDILAQDRDRPDCFPWEENRSLTWDDFKGVPKKLSPNEALTYSGMSIDLRCDGTTSNAVITCYFDPYRSWTKDRKSAELLRHEQLHFDITELFARTLRKQLSAFGNDCGRLTAHIQQYYDRNYTEFVAYQDTYDRESEHSLNKEKQAYWETKVARELEELKSFASLANN